MYPSAYAFLVQLMRSASAALPPSLTPVTEERTVNALSVSEYSLYNTPFSFVFLYAFILNLKLAPGVRPLTV